MGNWTKTRIACRAVLIKDGKILMTYEKNTEQWMIPGGGLEDGESEEECVVREIAEETGYRMKPSSCMLEINEYYEDWKWVNRYFIGEIIGDVQRNPTEQEKEVGMEPRWISVEEIMKILSEYPVYEKTNPMRCGMYYREYTALSEVLVSYCDYWESSI